MARARRSGFESFLHIEAARHVHERLQEVNRHFTSGLILSAAQEIWTNELGAAWSFEAPADNLALGEGAYDLIVHGLDLHARNDPVGQLIQCRRALRPDGLFLGVLLGGRTLSELRHALLSAEAALSGGGSPRVFPMGDIRDLGALLQRAGLTMPVADSFRLNVTYATAMHLMRDLRAMGETNVLSARDRRVPPRALFDRAAEEYAMQDPQADRITATFELVFLTGWAPSPDHPQPLKPGSASIRLADALDQARGEPTGKDPED